MIDLNISYTNTSLKLVVRLQSKAMILGFSGDSGVGKSTLFNIVSGLLEPERGILLLIIMFSMIQNLILTFCLNREISDMYFKISDYFHI
jgi:ABC-type molybdate transport system ATPase subunit